MQSSNGNEGHGKFLARTVVTGELEFLDHTDPAYLFTAGAAAEFIVADALKEIEFYRHQVYVRTDQGLYTLEHFAHLKDVQRVLGPDYFCANRGIVVNERYIRYPRQSSTVGLLVRDAKGQHVIEWIKLSRQGLREFKKRLLKPHMVRT